MDYTDSAHGPATGPAEECKKGVDIDPLDQLVSGPRLLEILWDAASRPSYRWL